MPDPNTVLAAAPVRSGVPLDDTTNVAIACQGGGSHTAFAAGVLGSLLREWPDGHELVGISGTSGGALNAVTAWYGLQTGDRDDAADRLTDLWDDLAADGPTDAVANAWLVGLSRIESSGLPLPRVSPYFNPGSELGADRIKRTIERHVDFDAISERSSSDVPLLVVGTVNVNAGEFETFTNEDVTLEVVLSSTAVPSLFEGVEMNGHLHWDGLFSQNPPIHDLMSVPRERKPDELWVIQINPQERDGEPTSLEEIADRRSELSGNISLNQELRFVERVNDWIEDGHLPESEFTKTTVRRIELDRDYHCSTKLDRSPSFIRELVEFGEAEGTAFLGRLDEDAIAETTD